MNEYEQWLQRRREWRYAERQAGLERMRGEWVGRRVWYEGNVDRGYAWVTGIDDGGWVALYVEEPAYACPESCAMRLEALGVFIMHV